MAQRHAQDVRGRPVWTLLQEVRRTIARAAPGASEKISYGMPTVVLGKRRVHYAGYASHIGFYPGAEPIVRFAGELARYDTAKGTVRLPLDEPLPLALAERIVKSRFDATPAKKTTRRSA